MYKSNDFSHDINCLNHAENVDTVNNIHRTNVKANKNKSDHKTPVGLVVMNNRHLDAYYRNNNIREKINKKMAELLDIINKYGVNAIHKSNMGHVNCYYGFYAMKIGGKLPVRLLYRCNDKGGIELHMVYQKNNDCDDGEYVKLFRNYAKDNK